MNKKILTAYFSCSGVTAEAAKAVAEAAGADLYEIKPEVPYTSADLDWQNKKSRSSVEMSNPSSRPVLADRDAGIQNYEAVFIGFPIWWYTAPSIIKTFLESYDFSGKKIVLFATSGGSGFGKTQSDLKGCCSPSTEWVSEKLLNGRQNKDTILAWINSLNL